MRRGLPRALVLTLRPCCAARRLERARRCDSAKGTGVKRQTKRGGLGVKETATFRTLG
jgi:hypothetical protein